MARPKKWEPWLTETGLKRIEGWALDGLSGEKIAGKMRVTPSTFYAWRKKHPEIEDAIQRGRAPVDIDVEHAMLDTAKGGLKTVKVPIKIRTVLEKPGGGRKITEHIEYADKQIYVPGNPMAQVMWLKNRKPDKWSDKPQAPAQGGDDPLLQLLSRIDAEAQEGAAP
jgi:hypothetical protein